VQVFAVRTMPLVLPRARDHQGYASLGVLLRSYLRSWQASESSAHTRRDRTLVGIPFINPQSAAQRSSNVKAPVEGKKLGCCASSSSSLEALKLSRMRPAQINVAAG
jgi:hypothetical protein